MDKDLNYLESKLNEKIDKLTCDCFSLQYKVKEIDEKLENMDDNH